MIALRDITSLQVNIYSFQRIKIRTPSTSGQKVLCTIINKEEQLMMYLTSVVTAMLLVHIYSLCDSPDTRVVPMVCDNSYRRFIFNVNR
jgi:hypothetical protein